MKRIEDFYPCFGGTVNRRGTVLYNAKLSELSGKLWLASDLEIIRITGTITIEK